MLWLVLGVATWYSATVGAPLYTDTITAVVEYRTTGGPFAAFPVEWYEEEVLRAGDWVAAWFPDLHRTLRVRALDAGPFGPSTYYYVIDWPELPIVLDLPQHLAPYRVSARVVITNVSVLYGRNNYEQAISGGACVATGAQGGVVREHRAVYGLCR